MDDEKNKHLDDVSEEEKNLEAEAQAEVEEDELRETLSKEFDLDPDLDEEFIEKLVQREKAHRERLSGAIKQKINWRERAQKTSKEPKGTPGKGDSPNDGDLDIEALVDKKLEARLQEQELKSLNIADEIKDEIKELASLKGISIGEAAKLPYIQSRIKEVEQEERVKSATPRRSRKGSYTPSYDPSKPLNPADFDLDTEEGIKAWQEAKKQRATYNRK